MNSRLSSSDRSPQPPEAYRLGRWFTAARREGLLALLSPEVWHTLSAILSFTSRDGRRSFTVDQLAVALGRSRDEAQSRLAQLTETQWHDQPLATLERDVQGEVAGAVLAPLETLTGPKAPLPVEEVVPAENAAAETPEAPGDDLVAELQDLGLNPDQIEWLLRSFPRVRIRRQLQWLPARQARNPAAMLLRAVEQDWGPPREAK